LDATWIVGEGSVPFKLEADGIDKSSIVVKLSPAQGSSSQEALRELSAGTPSTTTWG